MDVFPRKWQRGNALLALLLAIPAAASAQVPAYVFKKLVDSNDLVPNGNGALFQIRDAVTTDGSQAAFRNGPPPSFDSVWTFALPGVIGQNLPNRGRLFKLADLATDVPDGTGKFTAFSIDSASPGYPVLRNSVVVFAGRDSAASGYSGGLYAVSVGPNPVNATNYFLRVVNGNVPIPGGTGNFTGGFQDFSFDGVRVAFNGMGQNGAGPLGGVYAASTQSPVVGVVAIADNAHPAHPEFASPVTNFGAPFISGGTVAFLGRAAADSATGYNAIYISSGNGGFAYTERVNSNVPLPGAPSSGFHTRFGAPQFDGSTLSFLADDTGSGLFGLYRVPGIGSPLTLIADSRTALPGVAPVSSFDSEAAFNANLIFTASGPGGQNGLYRGDVTVGNSAAITKIVAAGEAGPFADVLGTVGAVEISPTALTTNGNVVVRVASAGGTASGLYLATPYPLSADISVTASANPASPALGELTTLTFRFFDSGPWFNLTRAVATVTLPPGLAFQSASSGGMPDSGGRLTYSFGLHPNEIQSLSVTVRVSEPGILTASVVVVADIADPNQRNNHAFVSVPAPGARSSNYLIRKLVDTQTAVPDRAGQQFFLPGGDSALPALDSNRVAFLATEGGASTLWIANADGSGGLTRAALTSVPGYPGESFNTLSSLRLRNGTVVFQGGTAAAHNGLYAVSAAGGAPRLVANTSTVRPERAQAFGADFQAGLLGDDLITFTNEGGLYAWPIAGGTGVAVAPPGTVIPVSGRYAYQFSPGAVSGARVVFGSSDSVVSRLLNEQRFDGGAPARALMEERRFEVSAATRLTASPSDPTGGTFSIGLDDIQVEGNTVVFRAYSGTINPTRGLYSVTGAGAPVKLVDTLTPVPGGAGNFSRLDLPDGPTSYSLNGGEVVFTGFSEGGARVGLYSVPATGGAIRKVVTAGDAITGRRTISDFSQPVIQANALGQRQVVFRADFFDAATNAGGSGIYVATPASRLINLSTRARVETGDNVMIGGFVVTGTNTKRVIVRALGPSLAAAVPGTLSNPTLDLFNGQNVLIASNDDWRSSQAAVQATGLAPSNDSESAIVMDLAPGNYTAIVRGAGGAQGVALVEAYDLQPNGENNSGARLINVSTRARVQTGDNVMIGGLVIGDGPNRRVLIRALGPSLAAAVPGTLANPRVDLFNGQNQLVASNDDWQSAPTAGLGTPAEISALGLAPTNAAESAILITLPPGGYTAIVRGQDGGSGVALVEAYEIP